MQVVFLQVQVVFLQVQSHLAQQDEEPDASKQQSVDDTLVPGFLRILGKDINKRKLVL